MLIFKIIKKMKMDFKSEILSMKSNYHRNYTSLREGEMCHTHTHTHTHTHMHGYRQWKQVDKLFVAVWFASDSSFGGCVSPLLSDMSLRCCLFCVDTHLCAEMGSDVFCVSIKCFPNQLIKNKYKAHHAAFMWCVFRLSYVRAHETKLSVENFHSKNNASTCIYTGWPDLCVYML